MEALALKGRREKSRQTSVTMSISPVLFYRRRHLILIQLLRMQKRRRLLRLWRRIRRGQTLFHLIFLRFSLTIYTLIPLFSPPHHHTYIYLQLCARIKGEMMLLLLLLRPHHHEEKRKGMMIIRMTAREQAAADLTLETRKRVEGGKEDDWGRRFAFSFVFPLLSCSSCCMQFEAWSLFPHACWLEATYVTFVATYTHTTLTGRWVFVSVRCFPFLVPAVQRENERQHVASLKREEERNERQETKKEPVTQ